MLKVSESRAFEDRLIYYIKKAYLSDIERIRTWKSVKLLDPAMPEPTAHDFSIM